MIFSEEELKYASELKTDNVLSMEDLINDFAVTDNNKIIFPTAKIEFERFNFKNEKWEKVTEIVKSLEDIRGLKTSLEKAQRSRILTENISKYVLGYENIASNFPYYGPKAIKNCETFREKAAEQQKFLIDNNVRIITISHKDCGYAHRCGGLEREYADFICDGENDTEILQNTINMYPNEYICILLHEDEYVLKPTSGSGTEEDPYICLNINRDNIIIRSCNRRTNITFDKNIVNSDNKIYLIKAEGENIDISNINFVLEKMDIHYIEYTYPNPTEKMLQVKEYVESFDVTEKIFNKKIIVDMMTDSSE